MEVNNRVFIDSNYLVAFFNTRDALHPKALEIGKLLLREKRYAVTSNLVFLEAVTVLSQRVGKKTAVYVGRRLLDESLADIVFVDQALTQETWTIFQNTKDKNISFVDCGIIATMRAEHIVRLLTFDVADFNKLQQEYHFKFFP